MIRRLLKSIRYNSGVGLLPAAKRILRWQSRFRTSGFTAIELIGVLAIIALLASVLVPNVIQKVDHAAWERERADLQTMAESFSASVLRNRTITDYAGMP